MTKLSQALKKYHTREGNKIVFKNKYSLNQLALEMWERLGYQGIDSSTLSRVINGERLFNREQLKIFNTILKLQNYEKSNLSGALEQDYLSRFGIILDQKNNYSSDVLNLLELNCKYLYHARERGNISFVNDWSDNIIGLISSYVRRESSEKTRQRLLKLLGDALYEKAYIYCSILQPEQNKEFSTPIVNKLFSLAKQTRSTNLAVKAYTILGFTSYALGKYSFDRRFKKFYMKSLDETRDALKISEEDDKFIEFTLIYWRYMAMNSIYINDKSLFSIAENKITEIVRKNFDNPHLTFIVCALDTLARGQSFFNNSIAFKTLEKVKQFDKKIQWRNPIRQASMIRNQTEVLINLSMSNRNEIIEILKKGLTICDQFKILRYKSLFSSFISRLS